MSNYIATVIKSGNSYALRIPKAVVTAENLKVGEKVEISDMQKRKPQNREKIRAIFKELQSIGAFESIKDPVAWQREIRKDRSLPGRD